MKANCNNPAWLEILTYHYTTLLALHLIAKETNNKNYSLHYYNSNNNRAADSMKYVMNETPLNSINHLFINTSKTFQN